MNINKPGSYKDKTGKTIIRSDDNIGKLPVYFNEHIWELYDEALQTLADMHKKNETTINYKNQKIAITDPVDLFLLYIIDDKTIKNSQKKQILSDIFFYDVRVVEDKASPTRIADIEKYIASFKEQLEDPKISDAQRKFIKDSILSFESTLKEYQNVLKNYEHANFQHNKDAIIDYILNLKDAVKIIQYFNNTIDSDSSYYVHAHDGKTYYLVGHYDASGQSNVDESQD